jgi:capsular polysaccharide biosynthesis protein
MINLFTKKAKPSEKSLSDGVYGVHDVARLPRIIEHNSSHQPIEENFTKELFIARGITRFSTAGNRGSSVLNNVAYYVQESDIDRLPKLHNDVKVLEFLSEEIKVVFRLQSSFYHFINDTLSSIMAVHAVDPNIRFILDTSNLAAEVVNQPFIKFLPRLLSSAGIKFEIVKLSDYTFLDLRNTLSQQYYDTGTMDSVERIHEVCKAFVSDPNVKPFRKVFVSRRLAGHRVNHSDPDKKLSWGNDNRIDSHEESEDFFRSLGFEVVYAENFKTFEEQIQFFYETEILIGTTGAGLTNAIFMQSGQTVVELQTPLMITMNEGMMQQELHFFYTIISFRRNHSHLMIPNFSRLTSDIKNKFKKDPFLKTFIERK